jgi:hypothetical protein
MSKKALLVVFILVLAMACGATAFAEEAASGEAHGSDFIGAIGGFLYNALPWNWGNWWGK